MKKFPALSLLLDSVKLFFTSPKGLLCLAGGFVIIAGGLLAYIFRGAIPSSSKSPSETPVMQEDEVPRFRHPLTGELLSEALTDLPRVFAVMIDHSGDALPQSGVDDAFLVIEAPVEAGIPRLQAFYYEGQPSVEEIGPVRSARPYFVDWANELDALYAHVGGSPAALDLIVTNGTFDFNQFWHGDSFWRSSDRLAPHNVYTSTDLLSAYADKQMEKGVVSTPLYGAAFFQDPDAAPAEHPVHPTVSFTGGSYISGWVFNTSDRLYTRRLNDRTYIMVEGDLVKVNNVIVLETEMEVVDAIGRREIRTIGSGDAWLFQDGEEQKITWRKDSASERLRFYDADGKEVGLYPGKTWIEVIEDEKQLSVE